MRHFLRQTMVLSLLGLLALCSAGKSSSSSPTAARVAPNSLPREPIGVYAKADIESVMAKDKVIKNCASSPGCDIHLKFREFYARLLDNPGISGLTVAQHWDQIQTAPDVYDFSFLDDAFNVANDKQKPVALIITPGVVSPKWLLNELPECIKNGVFLHDKCGKQAFEGFPEEIRDDGNKEIPLPWNHKYQEAWADFLGHLNKKYKDNPAFVAIAVAGPICASDEMILPTSENVTKQNGQPVPQPSGLSVDDTWAALISNAFPPVPPAFPNGRYAANPDEAFVDAWKQAIDTYEKIFSGITLTLSPDGGKDLPEFDFTKKDVEKILPPEVAPLYYLDCSTTKTPLSCEAKTEVINYFVDATCLTSPNCVNRKATRVGGLTASSNDSLGNIEIAGVKLVTSWQPPLLQPPPVPPLLGGAEFDTHVSGKDMQKTGCPDYSKTSPNACSGLTVEEAAYNVMTAFFNHTPAAPYFKGTVGDSQKGIYGTAPMHYIEVPYKDIEYANMNQCISNPSPTLGYMTVTQLLENASRDLFGIANGTLPICDTLSTCDITPPVTTAVLPAPTGLNGWYRGPVVINFNASDDLSGVFSTELSRDDQQTWKPLACGGLTLNDEGIHNVFARSKDLAGNREKPPILTTVKIDSTAPVTTVSTHQIRKISVVVSFTASDNLSGVARTEYSMDKGLSWTTGNSIPLTESGLYTILYRSIDVAGNVEKRNSITVNVNL
jgi:Beta-galactosidase